MEQNRLKHLRINAGLSVVELASRAKAASSTIYAIEEGRSKRLHKATIDRLAEALGVEPEELIRLLPGHPAGDSPAGGEMAGHHHLPQV